MKIIARSLASVVEKATSTFKCVIVSGPRQVGKTTLLKSIAEPERRIVSLDDPLARSLARRDPALFLSTYGAPLMIDEIQYAPELLQHIKMKVDATDSTGLYWMTGSQPFHMMANVSESLAGRIAVLTLQGLTEAEKDGHRDIAFVPSPTRMQGRPKTIDEMARIVFTGSFPQFAAMPRTDHALFMSSYVATYLSRDVRSLINAAHEHDFLVFLSCLAARSGQLLNASALASDVGVSATTIRTWVSILESSGVIVLLRSYRNNLTKRAIAMPKVYFTDTGLLSYLCGFRSPEEALRSPMWGHLFESWCVMAVLKSWWHSGIPCDAFFYRDREGHEIDLLVRTGMTLHPIEVKCAELPDSREIEANIMALSKTGTPLGHGAVVCLARDGIPLSGSLSCVNAAQIGMGANAAS